MTAHEHQAAGEELLAEANAALTRARGERRATALATAALAHFAAAHLARQQPIHIVAGARRTTEPNTPGGTR